MIKLILPPTFRPNDLPLSDYKFSGINFATRFSALFHNFLHATISLTVYAVNIDTDIRITL